MNFKISLLFLIIFSRIMFAQISGIVIESATLKPLSGVNLTAEKVGASTDKNGRFHLDVKAGTWIKISHVGYELKTVTAKDNMKIKMTLKILQSAEIIVRAGLTDESLQRTAASVTVLTKKDIKNVSNDHLQVLIDQIPNLNWAGGTSRPRYFQIRGIGERSHYFGEGAPNFSVGFVVDDMDLSGLGMLGQLYDLDQIELFRGPQSSVYGSNAVAGLILLRTSNPTDNFELKTQVSAGSGSHMGWNSLVNFKLSNDFSMRLSSVFNYNDGFRENVTKNLTNTNKREESLYRIKLGYSPNEKLDIIATFIYGKMNNGYDVWAPDNNTDFKTYSDSKGEDSQLTHGYSFRGNLNIVENIQLTSITSFTETDLIHAYDGDWADSTYWHDNHGFDPAIEGWSYSFFDKNEKNRVNLTQEFRLALTPLIMGIYYKNLKEQDEAIGYLFGGVATDAWSHFDFQAKAGYIQYGFDFSPTLKANANIRYEQNEYDYFGSSQGLNDNWEKEYLPPVECKTVNTMLGYRATFQYLLDEITSFYGTISNGYKSAGINQQPYLTDKARSYEPEFIQNFELGIKRISSTNQTQLTVFYSKRKNQQVSVSSQQVEGDPNSFLFYTGNATSGNLQGLEWEHSQIFSSSYKMNASVGYLNTWVNRFPYETSYGESYGGDREAAMAPEFMGSIGFDFHNESGFFMSALYSYKSAYYFSDSHNQKSKPYSLVNLTVGKISRNKTVKLWVKNLFDERYTVRGFYFGLIPPDYHDQLWKSYGDPRQVGITLDYNF